MVQAKLPLKYRDYCAHYYITYRKCKRDEGLFDNCDHGRHDWEQCQYENFVLRMKEYERERRLLQREKQLEEKKCKREERRRQQELSGQSNLGLNELEKNQT